MSSDTSTCPGCDKTFSIRGYESHLTQSKDPLCRAVYEELTGRKHQDSDLEGDDYATDYATDTFGQDTDIPTENPPVEDEEPAQSEISEAEDEDTAELDFTWEPTREGAPLEEELGTNDSQEEVDEDIGGHRAAERVLISEGHGVCPAVVLRYTNKYPSSAAGGVLARGETIDKRYRAAVSGQDKNPWAPFNSKRDWEVALWAKLRGPGSTAFSDLLSIPGVGFKMIYILTEVLN